MFRFPPHLSLFCACVGTGSQILTMAVCIFALALVGVFYPYNRGALLTSCVVRIPFVLLSLAALPVILSGMQQDNHMHPGPSLSFQDACASSAI